MPNGIAPNRNHGRRRPQRVWTLSDSVPTIGSLIASQSLLISRITPATAGAEQGDVGEEIEQEERHDGGRDGRTDIAGAKRKLGDQRNLLGGGIGRCFHVVSLRARDCAGDERTAPMIA